MDARGHSCCLGLVVMLCWSCGDSSGPPSPAVSTTGGSTAAGGNTSTGGTPGAGGDGGASGGAGGAGPVLDYYPAPGIDGWREQTDAPGVEALGVDYDALQSFLDWNIDLGGADNRSALCIKSGWIVGEQHDQPAARTYLRGLKSNSKAYATVLFGILGSEQGLSLSDNVYSPSWLPEGYQALSDDRKGAITFEQILRHTSGLCPEDDEPSGLRYQWPDAAAYIAWNVGHAPYDGYATLAESRLRPGQRRALLEHRCQPRGTGHPSRRERAGVPVSRDEAARAHRCHRRRLREPARCWRGI